MERAPYSHTEHWDLWEAAAERLQQADRFCSSPYWGVSLVGAFQSAGELIVYQHAGDMAVFHELDVRGGRLVLPCDIMWTLGSPILAADPAQFFERLCGYWSDLGGGIRQVTVGALYQHNPIWSSPIWERHTHWTLEAAGRQVASLEGGCDGFLARRSANFRSRLRRSVRKVLDQGVTVEYMPHFADPAGACTLLERAMRVEALSWKGLSGQGVDRGQMNEFYRRMLPLLGARGRVRGLFLRRDGRDLAYLIGAAFSGYFRGLQFSYLDSEAQSLGNVAQWMMIQHLVEEGCHSYDLGQAMVYKTRWAEQSIPSRSMAFLLGER